MNVLEKILEEILQYRKDHNLYAGKQVLKIEEIIRSHMDDLPDTNVGKWIPVTERLPETEKTVLMCGRAGWRDVGWCHNGLWKTGFAANDIKKDVVAWIPLPEAYRSDEEEKSA